MCADIDYRAQSQGIRRLHQLFGNGGNSHTAQHDGSEFSFRSGWHYAGPGERQSLRLSIDRNTNGVCESWQDEHPMVALSFGEFEALLKPWFEVHIFEHDYERIVPWDGESGNAIFACVKR